MEHVTQILQALDRGETGANERLLAIVYAELRSIAAAKMAREKPGHTLVPTALVHEAYMRLVERGGILHFNTRGHFFAAVAEVMRRILIDHARRKKSQKRGGAAQRKDVEMERLPDSRLTDDWIDLDEALTKLEKLEPKIGELVKLRYFAGLTIDEAAQSLEISSRTAVAWWTYARAWLAAELSRDHPSEPSGISNKRL